MTHSFSLIEDCRCGRAGDVKAVIDDIAALRPTIFIGVPRVYDRIYAGVIDQITKAGDLKKAKQNKKSKKNKFFYVLK